MLETFEKNKSHVYEIITTHGKYDFDLCKKVKEFLYLEGVELISVNPVYSTAESAITGIECVSSNNGRKYALFLTKNSYTFGQQKM
jgi:hypothetical protein